MRLNISINKLELRPEIIEELKQRNISEVKQLCQMKRKKLLELGLTNEIIEQIQIKLQLQGLDLAK